MAGAHPYGSLGNHQFSLATQDQRIDGIAQVLSGHRDRQQVDSTRAERTKA